MVHLKDIEALLSDLFDFDRLAKRKRQRPIKLIIAPTSAPPNSSNTAIA